MVSLRPPYDVNIPVSPSLAPFHCRPIPGKPPKDLILSNVYRKDDPYLADVDDDAKQKYIEQTRHLYRTETQLLQLSNRYLSTGNDAIAACVLDWLYELASADAFLGKVNSQGAYARQWSLGSFSSAYLQIKNYHQKDARKNKVVREWLSKIAVAVQSEYGFTSYINGMTKT